MTQTQGAQSDQGPGANNTTNNHPQGTADRLNLPEEFWAARPVLTHIRQAAHSRGRSADAVFGVALARLSAMVPHTMTFDSGQPGNCNTFIALIANSSGGKSTAAAAALDLFMPPRYLTYKPGLFKDGIGLGTGEGLAEAYWGTEKEEHIDPIANRAKMVPVRKQVLHNVYLYVDEGETLTKVGQRLGSTIGTAIRTAWSGGTLGQSNASAETTRSVGRFNYSLGIVIGYQKETVQSLLADSGPGTPQRFIYLTTFDGSIPDERVAFPDVIDLGEILDHKTQFIGGTVDPVKDIITFDDAIKDELWRNDRARQRQELTPGPLDGHEPLTRCKVSALLAVLDGRFHVTTKDWELSKMVWTVSCAVRDDAIAYGQTEARLKAERADEAAVARNNRIKDGEDEREEKAIIRCARTIARTVHSADITKLPDGSPAGVSESKAKQSLKGTEKKRYGNEAIECALAQGWIVKGGWENKSLLPGSSMPA